MKSFVDAIDVDVIDVCALFEFTFETEVFPEIDICDLLIGKAVPMADWTEAVELGMVWYWLNTPCPLLIKMWDVWASPAPELVAEVQGDLELVVLCVNFFLVGFLAKIFFFSERVCLVL